MGLTDPTFDCDDQMFRVLTYIGDANPMPKRIDKGMYEISHFSMGHMLGELTSEQQYPSLKGKDGYPFNSYGVVDFPRQLFNFIDLESDPRPLVVSFTEIRREEQSSIGGWRYHKWGPYLGNQNPKHEYIYDDTHIDSVWVYHIYEVPN